MDDFNAVVEAEDASHALAVIDAKLTLMKRIHSSRQRDNSVLGIDFDRSQARKMLPTQKSLNSSFQIAVRKRDRFTSHEYDTRFQIEFDLCFADLGWGELNCKKYANGWAD